jgi:quercetin dioxygenase-like cupin family protein
LGARNFIASATNRVYAVARTRTSEFMRTSLAYVAALTLSLAPAAIGQSRASDSPGLAKFEFENEQVRLLHASYSPRQKIPMHSHPSRVVVCITDMHVRTTFANGESQELRCKPGDSRWSEPVTHSVENLEDAPFEVVEIELKQANSPAIAVPLSAASAGTLTEPVPVEKEPHHHIVFQNQYVRVLDVFFPVGEISLFHTHSNDNIGIPISGDKSQAQPEGGAWSEPANVKPGAAGFRNGRGQAYTHRVRSAGKLPFHVVDVEIFP